MILIDHVTKRFGRSVAVDNVSLEIPAGTTVALWGPNGAGKTTLIRCVLGLLSYKGAIHVGAHDVRRRGKAARMLIGYVPQELGFYDDLRVSEALVYFARLKGITLLCTDDTLASVGLVGHGRKRIRDLSGGMKQRLALAIVMLGDPPVLVLDEVTASLDACGRQELVSLLSHVSGSGRTMLFASHRVEEVTTLARRVITMERGRISADTSAEQFAANLGRHAELHLNIRAEARDRAIELLRESGFAPRLNGVGILVPVTHSQKAAPFRVLAQGQVSVEDFDVEALGMVNRHLCPMEITR